MNNTAPDYIPVRSVNGRLLFKYDPVRRLVQIKNQREIHTIDLATVEAEAAQEAGPMGIDEALETIRRIAGK